MNIRPFTNGLRSNGDWERDGDSRAGGARVVQFKRRIDSRRTLHLQLWDGGKHRVSMEWCGRQATLPTYFRTVDEMFIAIGAERERQPVPRHEAPR